jgi:hypothetical protein
MHDTAANGHLNVVKWLHVNRVEGCTTKAMDLAACDKHLRVVQWLHINRHEVSTSDADIDTLIFVTTLYKHRMFRTPT